MNMNWHLQHVCPNSFPPATKRENAATSLSVDPSVSLGGEGGATSKALLRCLRIFPSQTIAFPSVERWELATLFVRSSVCEECGVQLRRGRQGESMITPTPFRFMVKTEGLLWMHVRGLVEPRPSTLGLPKQMFSRATPHHSLHPSLCVFLSSQPSQGKVKNSCLVRHRTLPSSHLHMNLPLASQMNLVLGLETGYRSSLCVPRKQKRGTPCYFEVVR